MSNEVLDIRELEFDEMSNCLNKSGSIISNVSSNVQPSFSRMNSVGLLKKSTDLIKKQTNIISNQIKGMDQSLRNTYDNFNILENGLYEKVSEIKSPTEFRKKDTSNSISMSSGHLKKDDGTAINADNANDEKDLKFGEVLEYNENLKKIVKDYEELNGEIDVTTNKTLLGNIKKDEVTIDETMEDSSLEEKIMKDISNEINERHPEFDDKFEVNKVYMKEQEQKQAQEEIDYDKLYDEYRKKLQEKLNDGNFTLENYK
ncbi:MAG: hypothetical protein IKQ33_00925 [Clostridia bacterium]|nr:hypothetical protein [Clostridia bacterium]